MSQLVRLASGAETCRGREEREPGDRQPEQRADDLEADDVRDRRRRQEGHADSVRESRRSRILERAFADEGLYELEVRQAREAIATAERKTDGELRSEQREQPPPAEEHREPGKQADHELIEPRRAGINHVEIAVRIRESLRLSLHFVKY